MKTISIRDVPTLAKKILIGILVTVVPFLILFGGLWATKKILSSNRITVEQK